MNCASCGRANRPTARFCNGCGQALTPRCGRCGSENAAEAQFCDSCGSPLAVTPASETSARKIVTIVFADLIGSVGLHERLDAENARRFTARYHEAMSAAVEAHGGTVVQLLGDGVLTAFGVPRVSEDDAIRGVRAAVAMQAAFRELLREQAAAVGAVGLRVAVNTGEVVVSSDQTSVIGDPTNVAARLQQEARDGDVLIGEATQLLVAGQVTLAPLGSFAIRGRVEPVSAFRVVSLDPPAGAQGTAFVGRDEELRRLRASYDAAVAAPGARLAVLLGSPGLGKSRLLAEFTRRLSDRATVLTARCDLARGHSFAPLAAALRVLLELEDSSAPERVRAAIDRVAPGADAERPRIATGIAALLAAAPLSSEEAFFVVRRLLAALAATRPVVVAIDDVQWAEPLLLDLAEHLVQWSAGVPLLVLLGARPELHETRAALTTAGGAASEVVTLSGLDASSAARLAANAIGADELPAAVVGRVLAVSEGNPLFVGELVRMLVHDGALKREGDRWTTGVELARLEIPPTIHALLAARIERLGAEDRAILECASVVGRRFSRAAVAHLLQREPGELEARLESLRRNEWVEPDSGYFLGEPALRFHHALIRDAAYRRLLRRTRAELHERLADWIAARASDAPEHEELLGRHLEQAHAHLKGLGPLDPHGGSLGARAARHLGNAGRLALARDDLRPAADLLGRALVCLDGDDPARADLALDWCEALLSAGEVGPAARALAELGRFSAGSERLRAWHACFAGELAVLTDPQALHATAETVSAAAAVLAAVGDVAGEAKAHSVHATALARLGQIGESEAALDRALAVARRARDRRRVNSVLAGAPVAALFGPSPVARASGRCLDVVRVLRITEGAPAVEAVALRCQAVLEALRGRTDAARRMIASARRTVEELGITQQLLEVEFFAGYIELLEGDREAAARSLSVAYEGLRKRGLGIDAARAAALLARTRLAQGDAVGAEVLSQESEALAGDDLNASIAWRGVRAEALARRGEHVAAVELARAAVEIAAPTDALLHHANARVALAVALRAAGRHAEAEAEQARAIELWEAKGATLLVERARVRVAQPARAPALPARTVGRRVRANAATANESREASPVTIHEAIASLGDSLAIFRRSTSIGEMAAEREDLSLVEVDATGRRTRVEVFADDHLGDALARLYERHAEALPEGAERARAAATARSIAALLGPIDLERYADAFASDVESIDHRVLGFATLRGAAALLRGFAVLAEMAEVSTRIADVLALTSDALLVRWATSGTDRAGGGALTGEFLLLWRFDGDGRVKRVEHFDLGSAAEALARFDELSPRPRSRPARRVRSNYATVGAERMGAALEARDLSAVEALIPDDFVGFHRPTGSVGDRSGPLAEFRQYLQGRDSVIETEPLATLGDGLGLFRRVRRFSQLDDVGPTVGDDLLMIETRSDVLAHRAEIFAEDRLGDAIARLYEWHAELQPAGPERDRAAAIAGSAAAMLATPDPERLAAAFAPAIEVMDSRELGTWSARGREAALPHFRSLLEVAEAIEIRDTDVLGLRSDALLTRRSNCGTDRASGGSYERHQLMLLCFDRAGLISRIHYFDDDREEEALASFDAADSEPGAPALANAASRALERFELAWSARDWEGVLATYAPGHAMDDRRPLFRMQVTSEDFLANERMLFEQSQSRWQSELVATRGEWLALLRVRFTAEADGGGPMTVEMLDLIEVDPAGRRLALVVFDPDDVAAALAELEARHLLESPTAASNAALRASARIVELLTTRDWPAFRALAAPDFRFEDRRRHSLVTGDVDVYIRNLEVVGNWPGRKVQRTVLATPSDELSLERIHYTGGGDGTEFEGEFLRLCEVDAEGRLRAVVHFDPDASPEGFAVANAATRTNDRFMTGYAARDWAELEPLVSPALVFEDRRRHVQIRGDRGLYFANLRVLSEGARTQRILLATAGERVALYRTLHTSPDTLGEFEVETLALLQVDAEARLEAIIVFDPGADGEARGELAARAARLGLRAEPLRIPPNAGALASERIGEIMARGNWPALRALATGDFHFDDRQKHALVSGDVELYIRNLEVVRAWPGRRVTRELLATFEEELALFRVAFTAGAEGGEFDGEFLQLVEIDAEGRLRAVVHFDRADRRAASQEMFERGAALHPSALRELGRALRSRDLVRARALLPDDFEFRDHRRSGPGRLGVDGYISWLESLFAESPDAILEPLCTLAREDHGALSIGRTFGTLAGGGEFENRFAQVSLLRDGRPVAWELFELEDLELARARLAELGPPRSADPLRIPPNSASRAIDRLEALVGAGDWEGLRALCAPVVMEDRRPHIQLSGDSETMVANLRVIGGRARFTRQLVATAGDRLSLERLFFSGPPSTFEIENLQLIEVDADGRICAAITFDTQQRAAAYDELSTRLAAGEAADCWPPEILELIRCLRDRDLGRLAKVLPEHVVIHDRRRTGIGRIEGATGYIASVAALYEQVEHFDSETLYWIGIEPHASLAVARTAGTLVVGGGEFESVFLRLVHHDAGGIRAIELFELDDLPRAQARFEKLRPDLLQVPPNAASRLTTGRLAAIRRVGDWEALRALVSPDFTFDDRRRGALVSGEIELYLSNVQHVHSWGDLSTWRELLASAGDRIVLERLSFEGGADGGPFEGSFLRVTELDADGRLRAVVHFDPDDRRGASLELLERFVRSGAPQPAERALATYRALYARDAERLRSELPAGFFFHDHRLTGPGRVEGEAYVAWQAGLFELSPDVTVEPLHFLAVEPHGCLAVAHTFGTQPHGGTFENAFVLIWGPVGVELFELADVARARGRFAELRVAQSPARANAASRAFDRLVEAIEACDWSGLEALLALDFVFEDRQRHSQIRGGRELYLANLRVATRGEFRGTRTLLATAGERLALYRSLFSAAGAADDFEIETFSVLEIDAEGRVVADLVFDSEAEKAARAELAERAARLATPS